MHDQFIDTEFTKPIAKISKPRERTRGKGEDDGREAGGNDDSGSSLICAREGERFTMRPCEIATLANGVTQPNSDFAEAAEE